MKTCPKCYTQLVDDALFCSQCGTSVEATPHTTLTCPSCGTENPIDAKFCQKCGTPFDIFNDVKLKTLSFKGAFNWGTTSTLPCTITINPYRVIIEWNVITRILAFGNKPELPFKEISAMGIIRYRGVHLLCIQGKEDDNQGFFSSMYINREKNTEFVRKLAYLIELYRRMYWWYDEYKSEDVYAGEMPIGGFEDDVENIASVSNEELIEFYKSL